MFAWLIRTLLHAQGAHADMPGRPSPETVRGLWAEMQRHYHTTVVYKTNAPEMLELADQLALARIPIDRRSFLERYATTIGFRVYVPFSIGQGDASELEGQIYLAVHEHVHVQQHLRDPGRYEWLYVTDSSSRAAYEAEAMGAEAELHYWLTGTVPNAYERVAELASYGCSSDDIALALDILLARYATILSGGRSSEAAAVAIRYLQKHAPGLRYQHVRPS